MIADLCNNLGANAKVVLNTIGSDSRIGTKYFSPGYSFGGPCFPRDTRALKQIMDQNNINSLILEGTVLYNQLHIDIQAAHLLKENRNLYIFENVCYKEDCNVPMIEESAKLKIAKKIAQNDRPVVIKDTEDIIREVKKEYGNIFQYEIKN